MQPLLTARELLSDQQIDSLDRLPFKRLSNVYEKDVPRDMLCQSLHVTNVNSGSAKLIMGNYDTGYYLHTSQTLLTEVDSLLSLGINKVFLQIVPPNELICVDKKIENCQNLIAKTKSYYGNQLEIVADPQGICFRNDLRWGVNGDDNNINAEKTLDTLVKAALGFAEAGLNGFITIGRINHEVKIVREAFEKFSKNTNIYSFSTNSETSNAYIQETKYDPGLAITGQKILVGNKYEMILRGLIDIAQGTQMILQKPIESFHLIEYLRCLIEGEIALKSFLDKPIVKKLIDDFNLADEILLDVPKLNDQLKKVKLGAYEVSGTYMVYKMLESNDAVSKKLTFALLDELYRGFCAAAGDSLGLLIGRNMSWYVKMANQHSGV